MSITEVVAAVGIIGVNVFSMWALFAKKFDKIEARFNKLDETLKDHGMRLTKLETKVDSIESHLSRLDSMMDKLLGYLLDHKTGTGK